MRRKKTHGPPRLAEKLFTWLAGDAFVEDMRGDLEELFHDDLSRHSSFRAQLNYWRRVIVLTFSYAFRSRRRQQQTPAYASSSFQPAILGSYFRVAIRNLRRDRFFAGLNVIGLAIGMSISLLLIAMLGYVFRYDTFHTNRDRIYRIISHTDAITGTEDRASSPVQLYQQLTDNLGALGTLVSLQAFETEVQLEAGAVSLQGFYATPAFLDIFTFPLERGNPQTGLSKPNTVLLTESAAAKLFGTTDAFGKVITVYQESFEVTGILKDHPKNSHLHFDAIFSFPSSGNPARDIQPGKWQDFLGSYQYVFLPDKSSRTAVERFLKKLAGDYYADDPTLKVSFSLQALNDIVPGPDLRNGAGPTWDIPSLAIFFVLTLLILLPACANYVMISISRSLRRIKEIGIRKAIGGTRGQIILQFVLEAILVAFVALLLSFYFFSLIRDEFLSMIVFGREALDLSPDFRTVALFMVFTLLVGFCSGIFPGVYFARLSALTALREKSGYSPRRFNLRKGILVVQFALSLGFIMAVVIVFSQYRKTLQYNFGFNQSNILDVELGGIDPEIVRTELGRLAPVESISFSSAVVGIRSPRPVYVRKDSGDSAEVFNMSVDARYIDNLGLRLISGRNFERDPAAARQSIIVNEQYLRKFGIKHAADLPGQSFFVNNRELVAIGVVADFHYATLRDSIQPFYFDCDPDRYQVANLRLSASDPFDTMSRLEAAWKTFAGERKFVAHFLEDEIEEAYAFHFSMIKICGFLGLLAISISCLGLLGMVVFAMQTRVKEIAIRKIMGSTTRRIVVFLSWDFAKLMLIAFAVATPLTYLFMDRVYLPLERSKIPIDIFDILISVAAVLALGVTTVLSQTVKASSANPVDSLRHE